MFLYKFLFEQTDKKKITFRNVDSLEQKEN